MKDFTTIIIFIFACLTLHSQTVDSNQLHAVLDVPQPAKDKLRLFYPNISKYSWSKFEFDMATASIATSDDDLKTAYRAKYSDTVSDINYLILFDKNWTYFASEITIMKNFDSILPKSITTYFYSHFKKNIKIACAIETADSTGAIARYEVQAYKYHKHGKREVFYLMSFNSKGEIRFEPTKFVPPRSCKPMPY